VSGGRILGWADKLTGDLSSDGLIAFGADWWGDQLEEGEDPDSWILLPFEERVSLWCGRVDDNFRQGGVSMWSDVLFDVRKLTVDSRNDTSFEGISFGLSQHVDRVVHDWYIYIQWNYSHHLLGPTTILNIQDSRPMECLLVSSLCCQFNFFTFPFNLLTRAIHSSTYNLPPTTVSITLPVANIPKF